MDASIANFVLARLDEVAEFALRAVDDSSCGRWQAIDGQVQAVEGDDVAVARWVLFEESEPLAHSQAVHIAMHDPETILAECKAKRLIVEEFLRCGPTADEYAGLQFSVQCLALPFHRHPDYQGSWRP